MGNLQPSIDQEEHDTTGGANTKKVLNYGWDGTNKIRLKVNSSGQLDAIDSVTNSLVPAVYDYISLSYTGSNLTGVIFKTGGSGGTTVSTLTLAYTGSNLTSVTKS